MTTSTYRRNVLHQGFSTTKWVFPNIFTTLHLNGVDFTPNKRLTYTRFNSVLCVLYIFLKHDVNTPYCHYSMAGYTLSGKTNYMEEPTGISLSLGKHIC